MTYYYTGVGSRKTPKESCDLLRDIAKICYQYGIILRSGAADGADSAFEDEAGNLKEIYIPWKKFNGSTSSLYNYSKEAQDIAKRIHGGWNNLSSGARLMHTRNVHQVLGQDLKTPSNFLIAWTEGGKKVGGTRTAILLAEENNVPVFNIGNLIKYDNAIRHIKNTFTKPA